MDGLTFDEHSSGAIICCSIACLVTVTIECMQSISESCQVTNELILDD